MERKTTMREALKEGAKGKVIFCDIADTGVSHTIEPQKEMDTVDFVLEVLESLTISELKKAEWGVME